MLHDLIHGSLSESFDKNPPISIPHPREYTNFLKTKEIIVPDCGIDIDPSKLNPMLFDWQRAIVKWALMKGRCALFEDCGLGKTPQQLEWSKQVHTHENKPVLILAPLAVASQTKQEGIKFGVDVNICETQADLVNGVNITNYEKLHHFSPEGLAGIVLDESSILKAFGGKTKNALTEFAKDIPYRLCCSATPAPNDLIELTNHSEFLGVMTGKEVIALFFTQDGNSTHHHRIKGHARVKFWEWMAEWSVAVRKPSDLGYDDGNFILPELNVNQIATDSKPMEGYLIPVIANTLDERRKARKASLNDRVAEVAKLANADKTKQWLIWCNLNAESTALKKAIDGAVEVTGSDKPEKKKAAMLGFSDGSVRVLVTKPRIAGFGMNWQNCHKVAFTGLSDSFEQYYQAVRRCWRFGQDKPVDVHIVTSAAEGAVVENVKRKEKISAQLFDEIVKNMSVHSEVSKRQGRLEATIREDVHEGDKFTLYLGDSIQTMRHIKDNSVGFSIFSPPFPGMYVYNNSVLDVGNCDDISHMIEHFRFLVNKEHLMRVLMPGRLCAIHLMQLTSMKSREGYIGIKDYRGAVIQMMIDEGWIFHGEVTIDKNPQIQAVRNKERGLMFKSLANDSAVMRMALADYLLLFRKPGDNPEPIRAGISKKYRNPNGWISEREWIRWASPVWPSSEVIKDLGGEECEVFDKINPVWYRYTAGKGKVASNGAGGYRKTKDTGAFTDAPNPWGIRETDVLNVRQARETDDERHLCPLQLGVINRAIKLWSAPGDKIYSPFTGVGSEGHEALKLGRLFVGGELKESYWRQAIRILSGVNDNGGQLSLFNFDNQDKGFFNAPTEQELSEGGGLFSRRIKPGEKLNDGEVPFDQKAYADMVADINDDGR